MHIRLLIALGIGALALPTSSLIAQTVITDITVTPSSEWGNAAIVENLVNNSGLFTAGDTSVPASYDLTSVHNFAFNAADQWHTATGDPTPTLTFDLGGAYDLTGIHIWNGNQGGDASNATRGVQQFDLLVSTDGGNTYTDFLIDSILTQEAGNSFVSAQSFDLTGAQDVTHVFMQIDSNYGNDYTGLSEVMFTAVPEPSTYALLLGGAACGIALIRRRFRR